MDIPFNHDYTLSRVWKLAKTYFIKTNTSSNELLEERSDGLRKSCEAFYPRQREMPNEDDLPEDPENIQVELRSNAHEKVMSPGSTNHAAPRSQETLSLQKHSIHDRPTESLETNETDCSSEQTKPSYFMDKIDRSADTSSYIQPNYLPIHVDDASRLETTEKDANHNLRNIFESDKQASDAIVEQKPVMAYFNYFSPEEDLFHISEVPVSPTSTLFSDETRVNEPSQSQTPEILSMTPEKDDHLNGPCFQYRKPHELGGEDEGEAHVLAPCCTMVKGEWEGLIKIIEGNHDTEIANMEEDFEFDKRSLQTERDEAQSLLMSLESEKSKMEDAHKETLRKLREKGKEVRELRRELKTKAEDLETKEEVESNQAFIIQRLQNEFAAEKEDLVKGHAVSLRELNIQHHNDTLELRKALHTRCEDLTRNADSLDLWKSRAEMLQAQHDDRCQTGMNCVQQVQDLKNQVGTQQRLLRENWPLIEQEIQEANTQTAVAQKNLEDFRMEAEKKATEADQRYTQLELKVKILSQKHEQAKKLLRADDTKATYLESMDSSAEELAKLMEKNHERVAEIHDLYQKKNTVMRNFQEQIDTVFTYVGELEVERNDYQASSAYFETEFMTLRDRFLDLEQAKTQLQLTINELEICNNDLRITNLLQRRN